MDKNRFLKLTWLLCVLACCTLASAEEALGWALQVVEIQIDGKAVETVKEVAVIVPGKDRAERRELRKGTQFEQGVEIVVPPRTVLVIASVNGNQVRLQPGSQFKANVVSGEGETYSVLLGQVFFKVSRALNFFNVTYQSFLAIVRGRSLTWRWTPGRRSAFG